MSLTQTAALGMTLAVEVPLVMLLARRWHIAWVRSLPVALLASCLTHPLAWKLSWVASVLLQTTHYPVWFLAIEAGVWLLEALVFHFGLRLGWQRACVLSLGVNLASALFGVLLWS